MIDNTTNKSRLFGYLNFATPAEATRCLTEMSNATIDSKQIILNKKKEADFDTSANLLVKSLPADMTQGQLSDLFKPFGEIVSCKLEMMADNKSREFGYVQFKNAADAKTAMDKLNGSTHGNKTIVVEVHQKKSERVGASDNFLNLYISNLAENTTEAQIREVFA